MGGAIAGLFVLRLQPALGGAVSCTSGIACVSIPANAAAVNFDPFNITVVLGMNNTIKWTNLDSVQHTVVVCPVGGGQVCSPSSAVASSPILSKGDTFQATLSASGTYHFYCSIHPATMRGTIVVVGGSSSTST